MKSRNGNNSLAGPPRVDEDLSAGACGDCGEVAHLRSCLRRRLRLRRTRRSGRRCHRDWHRLAGQFARRSPRRRLVSDVRPGFAAHRPLHRHATDEDPADVWHGLATDEATLVEQPRVGAVELLEGVVAENPRARLVGDAEHEGVTPADRARRRRNELVVGNRGVELGHLALGDAVTKRGIDDNGDVDVRELLTEAEHCFVELDEARCRTTLSGDVRAVDDHEVVGRWASQHHAWTRLISLVAMGSVHRRGCASCPTGHASHRLRATEAPAEGAATGGLSWPGNAMRTSRPSGRRAPGRESPWTRSLGCRTRRERRGGGRSRAP